jgi:hypothetical protein
LSRNPPPHLPSRRCAQFTSPGWRYLSTPSGGSGFLPNGGSYTTLIDPAGSDWTLVISTLQGACLHCAGINATLQTVAFHTVGLSSPGAALQLWTTNQSALFVYAGTVTLDADRSFTLVIPPDSMLTVSTIATAAHGSHPPPPPAAPFPLPYSDSFDAGAYDSVPRYWSDESGSFALRNGTLAQVRNVMVRAGGGGRQLSHFGPSVLPRPRRWCPPTLAPTDVSPRPSAIATRLSVWRGHVCCHAPYPHSIVARRPLLPRAVHWRGYLCATRHTPARPRLLPRAVHWRGYLCATRHTPARPRLLPRAVHWLGHLCRHVPYPRSIVARSHSTPISPPPPSTSTAAGATDNDPYTLLGDGGWTDQAVIVNATFSTAPASGANAGGPLGGGQQAVVLEPCDATSPYQLWANGSAASKYVSSTPDGGMSRVCLNIEDCGATVDAFTCVTSGGTCCGADCYAGLQWLAAADGTVRSALNNNCLTANGTGVVLASCGASANQTWQWDAVGPGQMQLLGSNLCLATHAPPPYVKVCVRVYQLNVFRVRAWHGGGPADRMERQQPPPHAPPLPTTTTALTTQATAIAGYCLTVDATGAWTLLAGSKTLASGKLAAAPVGWGTYTVRAVGTAVSAAFNGATIVGPLTDTTYPSGQVALGSGYHQAAVRCGAGRGERCGGLGAIVMSPPPPHP